MSPITPTNGSPRKVEELKKLLPPTWRSDPDSVRGATVVAVGTEDHKLAGDDPETNGLQAAKDGMRLDRATGGDLTVIGQNYGLARPSVAVFTDEQFAAYVQSMAQQVKLVRSRIYDLLGILLGDKAEAGWEVYEIRPNTITVTVEDGSFIYSGVSQDVATYLHGDAPVYGTVVKDTGSGVLPVVTGDAATFIGTVYLKVTTTGPSNGTAAFEYSLDGGSTWSADQLVTQAASELGSTGIFVAWPGSFYGNTDAFHFTVSSGLSDGGFVGDYLMADATVPMPGGPAGSGVSNTAFWLRGDDYSAYDDLLKLARAAGITVEFKSKGGA